MSDQITDVRWDRVLDYLTSDEVDVAWRRYQEECLKADVKATMSDFLIRLEEELYD